MTENQQPTAAPPSTLPVESAPQPPALDAHGFDPSEFEWMPVPRRPRHDGLSPDVQVRFIEALAGCGMVTEAAREVNISVASLYRARRARGGEGFAAAWDAAVQQSVARLTDAAFTRAIEGGEVPVFDRDGCIIGHKRQYSDRLLMFLLRAYKPEVFRHAHGELRDAEPPRRAAQVSVELELALARLQPVTPADPHLLLPPERLEMLVEMARDEAHRIDTSPAHVPPFRLAKPPESHPAAVERSRLRHEREWARLQAAGTYTPPKPTSPHQAEADRWLRARDLGLTFPSPSDDPPPRSRATKPGKPRKRRAK